MMKRINSFFKQLGIGLLLLGMVAVSSCSEEQAVAGHPEAVSREVAFAIRMPGNNAPTTTTTTRAMTVADENYVQDMDVLLFNTSTKVFEGMGQCSGTKIQTDVSDIRLKTFTVMVNKSGTFDVVLLANARALTGGSFAGMTKAQVLDLFTVTQAGKWSAGGGAGSTPIPMWGEKANVDIQDATTNTANPITLNRMLARVDVQVNSTAAARFQLKSVRVYNHHTAGSLAPRAAQWDAANDKALAPHVPSASTLTRGPLLYDGAAVTPTACTSEIYLFEAENHTDATHTVGKALLDRTCLVISGLYDSNGDGDFSDETESFYRVDFANVIGSSQVFLDVLRNHLYTFSIEKIGGTGYGTADDAFGSAPINIEAKVLEWNNASLGNLFANGQNMLAVSQLKYELSRDARTVTDEDNKLIITTDYVNADTPSKSGWTATVWADEAGTQPIPIDAWTSAPWFSLSTTSGTGNYPTGDQLYFHMAENRTTTSRTAWIHVKAGRLTAKVEVTQTTRGRFYIYTVDGSGNEVTDVVFAAGPGVTPTLQNITVNWKPESANLGVVNSTLGSTPFPSGVGEPTTTTIPGGTGTYTYTITPPALTAAELASDPFLEKTSKIDFTVNDGSVNLSHTLTLRQMAYNLVVQHASFYPLDGSTYTINVRSNTNWSIKSVSETVTTGSGNLLQSANELHAGFTGGANTGTGTPVTFTVTNNTVNLRGTLTIVFESTDSPAHFNDVTLVLDLGGEYYPEPHKGWAGSNIYWDGTKMTFDDTNDNAPNKNYGGLFFQWGSLYGLDPATTNWSPSCTVYTPDNTKTTGMAWTAIPRVGDGNITSNPPSGKTARDRHYLGEIYDPANGKGDICQHITAMNGGTLHGKKWRMPTSAEFGTAGDYAAWSGSGGSVKVDGTGAINAGRDKNTDIGTPRFPAAGFRHLFNGSHVQSYDCATYWSATPFATLAFELEFYITWPYPQPDKNQARAYGFSVRCVQE